MGSLHLEQNLHPLGMSIGVGVSPDRRILFRLDVGSGIGTLLIKAFVYGCIGSRITSSIGPFSTIFPRYITIMRSPMIRFGSLGHRV